MINITIYTEAVGFFKNLERINTLSKTKSEIEADEVIKCIEHFNIFMEQKPLTVGVNIDAVTLGRLIRANVAQVRM